jgi:hypothetical protein
VVHGTAGSDTRLAGIAFETSIHGLDQEAPFTLDLEVRGPGSPPGKLALKGSFTAAEGGQLDLEGLRAKAALELTSLDLHGLEPLLAQVAPIAGLAGIVGRARGGSARSRAGSPRSR